jgi:hypothetical protein
VVDKTLVQYRGESELIVLKILVTVTFLKDKKNNFGFFIYSAYILIFNYNQTLFFFKKTQVKPGGKLFYGLVHGFHLVWVRGGWQAHSSF